MERWRKKIGGLINKAKSNVFDRKEDKMKKSAVERDLMHKKKCRNKLIKNEIKKNIRYDIIGSLLK